MVQAVKFGHAGFVRSTSFSIKSELATNFWRSCLTSVDASNCALILRFGVLESAFFTLKDRCITEAPGSIILPMAVRLLGHPHTSPLKHIGRLYSIHHQGCSSERYHVPFRRTTFVADWVEYGWVSVPILIEISKLLKSTMVVFTISKQKSFLKMLWTQYRFSRRITHSCKNNNFSERAFRVFKT